MQMKRMQEKLHKRTYYYYLSTMEPLPLAILLHFLRNLINLKITTLQLLPPQIRALLSFQTANKRESEYNFILLRRYRHYIKFFSPVILLLVVCSIVIQRSWFYLDASRRGATEFTSLQPPLSMWEYTSCQKTHFSNLLFRNNLSKLLSPNFNNNFGRKWMALVFWTEGLFIFKLTVMGDGKFSGFLTQAKLTLLLSCRINTTWNLFFWFWGCEMGQFTR